MTSSASRSLTERALERLLERLGSDRDAAGLRYQALRQRLADYFDWKGVRRPEVAADETLDRLARKLDEDEAIERVEAYAFGVARRVLLEQMRHDARERKSTAAAARESVADAGPDEEDRVACLARCVLGLSEPDRNLIVAYYQGAGRAHLEERKDLAVRLGIQMATLKTRAHRLRVRLRACMDACLKDEDGR